MGNQWAAPKWLAGKGATKQILEIIQGIISLDFYIWGRLSNRLEVPSWNTHLRKAIVPYTQAWLSKTRVQFPATPPFTYIYL